MYCNLEDVRIRLPTYPQKDTSLAGDFSTNIAYSKMIVGHLR